MKCTRFILFSLVATFNTGTIIYGQTKSSKTPEQEQEKPKSTVSTPVEKESLPYYFSSVPEFLGGSKALKKFIAKKIKDNSATINKSGKVFLQFFVLEMVN